MVAKIKVTNSVKEILNDYDADELLRTIPYDYKPNIDAIHTYSSKVKSTTPISITLTTRIHDWINAMAKNHNIQFSLLFNFLIETVANCGKINTKNIKKALDCYYYAAAHDKSLFSQILSEYALSDFYKEDTGLSEEGIAYFLTTSEIGKELIRNITPENLNQNIENRGIALVLIFYFIYYYFIYYFIYHSVHIRKAVHPGFN